MDKKTHFRIYAFSTVSKAHMQIAAQDVLYLNTDTFINAYLKGEVDKRVAEFNKQDLSQIPEPVLRAFTTELSDYYGITHLSKDELSKYMIVAAYGAYERAFKGILGLTGSFTDDELRNCYKKKDAVRLLKQKLGIKYKDLTDNKLIEELRCLNNDIKHNGIVGKELEVANPKWKRGMAIENTHGAFKRLCNAPYNLLTALANKIEATL